MNGRNLCKTQAEKATGAPNSQGLLSDVGPKEPPPPIKNEEKDMV